MVHIMHRRGQAGSELRSVKDTHDDGAATVSALVLGEVVASAELLTAVGTLERLLTSVERAVVSLEVLLSAEAATADVADEGL